MQVILEHIGKRFVKEWIVKDINEQFSEGENVAILGPNGSGKSTLLRIISSFVLPTEGTISYSYLGKNVPAEEVFKYISYAAPYLELIGRMTLEELIVNHQKFKPFYDGITTDRVLDILEMNQHRTKQVYSFSSGMKMRVRLALGFLSDTPLLLLDEPLSNLDQQGKEWYRKLAEQYLQQRLVIVCSNKEKEEYFFCQRELNL